VHDIRQKQCMEILGWNEVSNTLKIPWYLEYYGFKKHIFQECNQTPHKNTMILAKKNSVHWYYLEITKNTLLLNMLLYAMTI
jgi:hypothetical protein